MVTKYADSGISPRINAYAAAKMLAYAGAVMVLDKTGPRMEKMPGNSSQTVKFRRPVPFDAATIPLVEGVTPSARTMSYEDVQVTLNQYGELIIVTDVISDTHEDPVINDAAQLAGENIGRTMEALNFGVLKAGTNVFYTNGSSRAAVNTVFSLNKQRAITRALKAQKARKIREVIKPSPNYETRGVEASYIAVGHTDMEADLRNISGFKPVIEYGHNDPICADEIGKIEDVRYILSADFDPWADAGGTPGSMVSTSGSAADVYPLLFFSRECWGTVALKGHEAVDAEIIPTQQRDKSDPLGQRGYVGWKSYHASLILNQNWLARCESAVTDL